MIATSSHPGALVANFLAAHEEKQILCCYEIAPLLDEEGQGVV
jgi:hypothetical protein